MNKTTLFALALAASLAACSSGADENVPATGIGSINVLVDAEAGFAVPTRALNEDNYKIATNYNVEITDADNQVVKTFSMAENNGDIELPIGTYTVRAYYGAEHNASRDEFLCEDSKTVNIVSGESTACSLACHPTCAKTLVRFDAEMATYFDNYYVTYSTNALGSDVATWAKDDTEPWYLLVDAKGETVTATIHLVPKAEYDLNKTHTEGSTAEGTVVKTYLLQPNRSWTLNIVPSYTQSTGSLGISIEIDESTNDKEVDIEIPSEWI